MRHVGMLTLAAAIGLVSQVFAARADCASLTADFDKAFSSKLIDTAHKILDDISDDLVCSKRAGEFTNKFVELLIAYAEDSSTKPADRDAALTSAAKKIEVSGTWRTAARLGDYYLRKHDNANAFNWYEQGISYLKSRPGVPATDMDEQALFNKAGVAKGGAAGRNGSGEGKWQVSTRSLDGSLGGIYTPGVTRNLPGQTRQVTTIKVPLPIRFYTNETRFTPEGDTAVRELADAANQQQVKTMKLVGHADPRGTDQYNLELSHGRVEAVRKALLALGVRANIEIDWVGSRQPFDAAVLPYVPDQQEKWALDRRVEWIRGGDAD